MPGRPLKVGVQLPEVEWEARWTDLRAMALRAEELGFDSLWYGDHLLYRRRGDDRPRGPWEAWTVLAGLAAVTSRISIGPLVAATAFHAPAMLAKMAATVDEVSGGRLILGLGAGWNDVEFAAFGFPFDRRISRFEEAFTIVRTLLREGEIDFAGEFYTARDCELVPRPRPGGPPLMIGSSGPRMLEITAPHVDAWNAWFDAFGNRPGGIAPLRERPRPRCDRADGRRAGAAARRPRPRPGREGQRRDPAGGGFAGRDRGDAAGLRRRGDRPRPARRGSDHARLSRRARAGPGGPRPGIAGAGARRPDGPPRRVVAEDRLAALCGCRFGAPREPRASTP
jgi:alkanesulfonate monooxygenase SsuD/methylene tetrahydromethanopterin reductase-like flavin-dependent oxidoreductase (luciferase family)